MKIFYTCLLYGFHTDTNHAEGNSLKLVALQKEYQEEYEALSKEEKDELIEEFNAYKQDTMKICCLTAHTCIQDVANVAHNVQLLVSSCKIS